MTAIDFHLDFLSPYACLAFHRLPQALEGLSYHVRYRPLLFAGLLAHWGQKGPAEIEPKRAWTFRQVHWLAHRHGIALDTPAEHPFNPLPLLRLALASVDEGDTPNREVCRRVFEHVWRGGASATDPARVAALAASLPARRDPAGAEVKQSLRAATDAALARGVFGVPTFEVDGRLFFGLDSREMVAAAWRGDPWFAGPASPWQREGEPRPGVKR